MHVLSCTTLRIDRRNVRNWALVFRIFCGPIAAPLMADSFTWDTTPITANWDNHLNWFGPSNQFPDDELDSAFVNGTASLDPTLTSNRTIGALTISAGGDVLTGTGSNNYRFVVSNSGGLSGMTLINGLGSSLTVYNTSFVLDAITEDFRVGNLGQLILSGNPTYQVNRLLDIDLGGEVAGFGTINVAGSTTAFNDGTIRASGGTLRITSSSGVGLDFDGLDENGSLVVDNNSTLILDIPFSGSIFDGTIVLQNNSQLLMNHNWTLAVTPGSTIDMNGGMGSAVLGGTGTLRVEGWININSGTAVLATPTLIANTGEVLLKGNTTLQIDAPTTFQSPESFNASVGSGSRTLVINAHVFVGSGSGYFGEWDASPGGVATTIVNPTGDLDIDVLRLDPVTRPERYDGILILNSGDVDVQVGDGSWEMSGNMQMNNTAANPPILSGDEVVFTGQLNVGGTGLSRINADAKFNPASDISVASGAQLMLAGPTTDLAGGQWTGAGVVNLDSPITRVTSGMTVNMPSGTFDLDGGSAIGSDRLIINSEAVLNVNSVDDEGNSIGDRMEFGQFGSLRVQLTDPTSSWSITGPLTLTGLPGAFSTVHLRGSDIRLAGATQVTGNSIIEARVEMAGSTAIGTAGRLILRGGTALQPNVVETGATFSGTGDLVVWPLTLGRGYLQLNDNAHVAVDLINEGHLEVGAPHGFARVASLTQSTGGTYEVDIDGLAPVTEYDVLRSDGPVQLDGTLDVRVNNHGGSYVGPTVRGTFDQFDLIDASTVAGTFATFRYNGIPVALTFSGLGLNRYHVGAGRFRILDYDLTGVDFLNYFALPGDANGDGSVDGSDYGIWNTNKFTAPGNDWTKGDFNGDGVVDGSDFAIWNTNKFTSVALGRSPAARPESVPEPSLLTLAATLAVVVHCLVQRQKSHY